MSLRPIGNSLSIRLAEPVPGASAKAVSAAPGQANNSRIDLLRARDELLQVHDALQKLGELMNIRTSFSIDFPNAVSASAINIDLTTTASSLFSTEAINASPRSFTPFGPDWDGGSSALVTIGGEYDGSIGSGALSFEVRRPGIRGTDDLRIRAFEPDGSRIRTYNIRDNHPLDRQYNLRNGLFFTLGSGTLIDDDTAEIQISDSVGSVFDPDLPFNGVRNNNPNFQYYEDNPLEPVIDGSFELNGETIAVNADDTLTSIIERINQSAAGVTASYNSANEQVEFTQLTPGSLPSVDIQNDTSNLIDAVKLGDAVPVPGIDPESEQALQDVAAFSTVQSGSIFVNGAEIAVDTASDSLNSLIQAINVTATDVTASFDPQSLKVKLEGSDEMPFDIDSNGTNLFAALNITDGRVDGEARGISRRRAYAVADRIEDAFSALNKLFTDGSFKDGADHTGIFRNVLANAVDDSFRTSRSDALYGLSFDSGKTARRRGFFAGFDRQDFTQSLRRNGSDVKQALAGSHGSGGLVNDLGSAVVQALKNVNEALGLSSSFIDTFA